MRHALCLCLVSLACAPAEPSVVVPEHPKFAEPEAVVLSEDFRKRLVELARDTEHLDELTILGDVPEPPRNAGLVFSPYTLRSQCADLDAHGGRSYFLFVLDVPAYRARTEREQPVGQALLFQTWESGGRLGPTRPLLVQASDSSSPPPVKRGSPGELFAMYKLEPDTPNTDSGWVFGTISSSGELTSAGRVPSCMRCHGQSEHDRTMGAVAEHCLASNVRDRRNVLNDK